MAGEEGFAGHGPGDVVADVGEEFVRGGFGEEGQDGADVRLG